MKPKEALIILAALAAIGLTSYWGYRYERRPDPHLCAICNRAVHAGMSYRLETRRGGSGYACCPRCGMHYTIQHAADVQRAWAVDLNTGESIPAEAAYYEEGGDVEYCTHGEQPVERQPEGVAVRGYDRCLPTLVAFRGRAEAEAYQRQHGGRVLDYAQAIESVRTQ
jgi:hypothetical protein